MKRLSAILIVVLTICLVPAGVWAGDSTEAQDAATPPMGPPDEIKEMSFIIGDWDVAGKAMMDPTSEELSDYTATATYSYAAGGAAIRMDYKGQFMGMDFIGISYTCYDRESQEWQMTWVDNMSGRISLYTGQKTGGKTVVIGEDKYQGQVGLSRMTTYDETETSFKWLAEYSKDGGKSWSKVMDAVYTKK
jgi:hypothetical protein